jgi:hypothetical protein
MPNEQPLKLRKILQDIRVGEYVQFLYPELSKEELEKKLKEQIKKDYDFYTESKKGNQKLINIYTTKNIYQVKNQTIINQFDRLKAQIKSYNLEDEIKSKRYIIHPQVIDKFRNKNLMKIEEVLYRFIEEGEIRSLKENGVELIHKRQEVTLIIDFHNDIIRDIITYRRNPIDNNSIIIEGEKMKVDTKKEEERIRYEVFINQLNLLDSNIINAKEAINDIKENLINIDVEEEKERLCVETKNCLYVIENYNIVNIYPKQGFIIGKPEPIELDDFTLFTANNQNNEYLMRMPVVELYNDIDTARKYMYLLGLSIKVITKFITDDNIRELYNFLVEDIVNFGYVLYDNYMDNCKIIKTRRFYYLIKNDVIINIKTLQQENISECSIRFQRVYIKDKTEKTNILDLEVGDRVRDYITFDVVNNLRLKEHAKERYRERISKKVDSSLVELIIKQDIYKNGTVYMGTYYNNTKLIKGLKNIYIIDNYNIISVWRINPSIENIGERYMNLIEEITMAEVEENEII